MNGLHVARQALADKLLAAGLKPSLQPGQAAPYVLVALPFIEKARTLGDCVSVSAEYRILVLAPGPGDDSSAQQLLTDIAKALVALAKDMPSEATPTQYGPENAPLPAYEFTVTKHVRISTEGV